MTSAQTPAGGCQTPGTDHDRSTGNTAHFTPAAESWRALIDDGRLASPDVGCLACGAALTWDAMCEPCVRAALAASLVTGGMGR